MKLSLFLPLPLAAAGLALGIYGGQVTADFISWFFTMDQARFQPIKLTLSPVRIVFTGLWSVLLALEGLRFGRDFGMRRSPTERLKFLLARAFRIAVSSAGAFAALHLGLTFGWLVALDLSDFYRPYAHPEDHLEWLIAFSEVLFGCQIGLVLAWVTFRVGRWSLARVAGLIGLAVAFEASERTAWWVWDNYRLHATSFEDLGSKFTYTQSGTLLAYSAVLIVSGLLLGRRLERRFRTIGA
jgi:hypothetical protein